MAWTVPRTYVTAEFITGAILNTDVRDNSRELWHVVETVPFNAVAGPGQGHIYGIGNGVLVAALTVRTYPGFPVEITLQTAQIRETVTTDGGWRLGFCDGAPGLTLPASPTGKLVGQGTGTGEGSGEYTWRLTPSAASHTYGAYIWSENGTGADSVSVGQGFLLLREKGGT